MKKLVLIGLILIYHTCTSQNLVTNGSFEEYSGCPDNYAQFDSVLYWMCPSANSSGQGGSPDYFNTCSSSFYVTVPNNYWGYQQTHSGNGYAGLCLVYIGNSDFREYIEGRLSSPLLAGRNYIIEMYLNSTSISHFATDAIGVYFSDTAITGIANYFPLNYSPQIENQSGNYFSDTSNWILFSKNYIAHGGENYFIIGNFKDDANTSTIVSNNSATGQYSYILIDDVSIELNDYRGIDENEANRLIKLYPNPFNDVLHIKFSHFNNTIKTKFILYDDVGRVVKDFQILSSDVTLSRELMKSGIYFYSILENGIVRDRGKVILD